MNPLIAQLTHRPFPEVAAAIRASADQITRDWDAAVRKAMPQMQKLTFEELKDSTPEILLCIAEALASDDPEMIDALMGRAPAQGLSRFRLNFDVVEVMQEDRLLRSITVQHAESHLGRRMDAMESAALHAAIDVMLQRSVIALVDKQKVQLRAAAETELKFLSFLSHDMRNNLNSVLLTLQMLGMDLRQAGGFAEAEQSLDTAQQAIHDTVAVMRQMLDHERLRQSGKQSLFHPVDLHALAKKAMAQFSREAAGKGVKLAVEIGPGTVVESDPELLSLVLQNLVGNAVKYSDSGVVRVGCATAARQAETEQDLAVIWVSDNGHGIAPEKIGQIFDAYKRGQVHGQQGFGLGLAIASQAAKLLDAQLTVESTVGAGTTFRLSLAQKGLKESPTQVTPLSINAQPGDDASSTPGTLHQLINRIAQCAAIVTRPDSLLPSS
jgi:signal transduction histidine kinase